MPGSLAAILTRELGPTRVLRLVVPHRTGYPPNPPLERIDFEVQAGEIAELVEPGTHLVGHSYGGVVSLLEGIWHLSPIEARDSPATNDLPITMRLAESPEPFDSPSARVGLRIDQARAVDDLTAHIGLPPRLRVVGESNLEATLGGAVASFGVRCQRQRRSGRPWHRAELPHHPELIELVPVLDDPAVADTEDVDLGDRVALPARRQPHELAGLGRTGGEPGDDLIALRDQVVDRERRIGQALRDAFHGPLQVASAVSGRWPRVRHKVLRDELVDGPEIALLEHVCHKSSNDRLVLVGTHRIAPLLRTRPGFWAWSATKRRYPTGCVDSKPPS